MLYKNYKAIKKAGEIIEQLQWFIMEHAKISSYEDLKRHYEFELNVPEKGFTIAINDLEK